MTRSIYSLWPWNAVCAATAEPNQPGGLTATAVSTTTISLSWTADSTAAPNEATSYAVERSIDGLGSWSTIATNLTSPSYSDASLSASQTRWYRVSAYNCFGGSLASATANATTQSGALSPSWSLDFSSGTPSGYTLTRASSGTYVDSSGYVASAASDIARLTHDSSGSRLGLLVEESRTNILKDSNDFSTGNWTRNAGVVVTSSYATGPDNTTSASRVQLPNTTALQQPISGSNRRVSFWIKSNTGSNEACAFWNGSANVSVTATTSWVRHEIATTAANFDLYGFKGLGTTSDVLLYGAQCENATTITSYIPTTTAQVTRSADLAHVLDSNITSWGDPGALVIHFYPLGKAGTLLSTDDASTAQVGIEASSTTAARAFWSSGSTSTGTIGSSGVQKAVHYWNGSTSKFAINGSTPVSGTNNLTIGNTDFVTLGAEATDSSGVPGTFSQYANCVIRKVEFYSGALTDANLQTITT
jgi:hypothetical protein